MFVIPEVPAGSSMVLNKVKSASATSSAIGEQTHIDMLSGANDLYLTVQGGPSALRRALSAVAA
jgi:hypothetical protein